MAKLSIKPGSTDITVYIMVLDPTSLTGAGKTGLTHWSSGVICYYVRTRSNVVSISLGNVAVNGAHIDGGFIEVSSASMPGLYRLDLPDAVCAAGARSAVVMFRATDAVPVVLEIDLSNDANVEYWKGAAAAAMTGDAYARLGAPAGASMSADVAAVKAQTAAIEADTQDLQVQIGVDGAGLTALPWNAAWDAEVQSEAVDALVEYDPPTKAELDSSVASLLSGLSGTTVTVVSSVDGGLVTVYVADTWRFTVASDQLDLADYETLGLVVKQNERQADSQALLYLRSDTGLARIGGAAPVSAGNGTLTAGASSFTAVVHVAETQALKPKDYIWWLKGLDTSATPDEAVTLATGSFVVLAAGLQAVV